MRSALFNTMLVVLVALLALASAGYADGRQSPPTVLTRAVTFELDLGATQVAWSPDGALFAVARGAAIDLYDGLRLHKLRSLTAMSTIQQLAFSNDGTTIAATQIHGAMMTGVVSVWRTSDGALLQTLEVNPGHDTYAIIQLVLSADGSQLAWIDPVEETALELWDTQQQQMVHQLTAPIQATGGAFSPDGSRFALYEDYVAIYVFDSADGRLLVELPVDQEVGPLVFSPDGRTILGSWGRTWDLDQQTQTTMSYQGQPQAVSPDGKHVVTSGYNSVDAAGLWALEGGQNPRQAFEPWLKDAAFRADGGALLTLEPVTRTTPDRNPVVDVSPDDGHDQHEEGVDLTLWTFDAVAQPAPLQTAIAASREERARQQTAQAADVMATQTAVARGYTIQGRIDIPGYIVGGEIGERVSVTAHMVITQSEQPVVEMRLAQQIGACPEQQDVEAAPWEPFAPQRELFYELWSGHNLLTAAVQFRDAAGNLSIVYCGWIDSDGMPPRRELVAENEPGQGFNATPTPTLAGTPTSASASTPTEASKQDSSTPPTSTPAAPDGALEPPSTPTESGSRTPLAIAAALVTLALTSGLLALRWRSRGS